jgi:hypothetical protein
MGLGMATGLGAFAVAGLATAFLCVSLLVLDRVATQKARVMSVELSAPGSPLRNSSQLVPLLPGVCTHTLWKPPAGFVHVTDSPTAIVGFDGFQVLAREAATVAGVDSAGPATHNQQSKPRVATRARRLTSPTYARPRQPASGCAGPSSEGRSPLAGRCRLGGVIPAERTHSTHDEGLAQ